MSFKATEANAIREPVTAGVSVRGLVLTDAGDGVVEFTVGTRDAVAEFDLVGDGVMELTASASSAARTVARGNTILVF